MSARRQWALVLGIVGVIVFGVALLIKIRPQLELVAVGTKAPDFHAVDLATGKPVTLDDYRGHVLLINIWATWCEPCRIEMPAIERLHHLITDTSFRILAVSVDKTGPEPVRAYAKDMGLTFPILQDATAKIQDLYQTTGVPESYIVDRQGIIVKRMIGASEWDSPDNVGLIRRMLDAR